MFVIILVILVLLSLNEKVIAISVFPKSPCPETFTYEKIAGKEVHGVVKCKNDLSGIYMVQVNMTVTAIPQRNLAVKKATPTEIVQSGGDIVYHVIFPKANALPKVTNIVCNDKPVCTAAPDPGGFIKLNAFQLFSAPVSSVTKLRAQPSSTTNATGALSKASVSTTDNKRFESSTRVYSSSMVSVNVSSSLPKSSTTTATTSVSTLMPATSTVQVTTAESKQPSSTFTPCTQNLDSVSSSHKAVDNITTTTEKPISSTESSVPPSDTRNASDSSAQTSTTSILPIDFRFSGDSECGMAEDTTALVFNGSPTSETQHPWLVAMFHLQKNAAGYTFKCAATLISKKHVVTESELRLIITTTLVPMAPINREVLCPGAAHCVRSARLENAAENNTILVLGKHNILSWAWNSEIRNVEQIYVHPQYKKPSDADIAVITMSKTVEYTTTIKAICLWEDKTDLESIVGINGTVVGWGKDELGNAFVPEPKQLQLPVVSQEDCLRADDRFLKLTSPRTFCAGNRNGEAPCTGDSGGGFFVNVRGRWTLRGIVSSALVDPETLTCDVNNYVVFADVTKYMDWVSRVLIR